MADGTYWDGRRWVSPEIMAETRRMLPAKPRPQQVKQSPKKPKESEDDESQAGE